MINFYNTFWIILAVLLYGFFTGIHIAFVNINRLSVELKKKQGRYSGKMLSNYFERPGNFIGVTLVGSTISLIIYGLLIGIMLNPFWNWLIAYYHIPEAFVNIARLLFETVLSFFIIILLGEFIPAAIWRAKNEWLLNGFTGYVVNFFYNLLMPIVNVFGAIAEWILKYIFNIRLDKRKEVFSRYDLEYFYQQTGDQAPETQELNTELFENALSLPSAKVRKCLIPRKEIEGVDSKATIEELRRKFIETKLSKLVVYEENIDHIIGYVHQLDMFKKPQNIQEILLPIPAVPESMSVTDLINQLTHERKSIAWVVDEFGGTAGIVTMENLLEELFGDIQDEYDTEELEEKQVADNEYILSGRLKLDYLSDKYNLEFVDNNDSETLSGYIIEQHETIPKVKDRIIAGDYEFEILAVSDTRIETARLKVLK